MSQNNNFKVKKGLDVRNGRFIVDENEVSIDGDLSVSLANPPKVNPQIKRNMQIAFAIVLLAEK